jgi:hypothetical protein
MYSKFNRYGILNSKLLTGAEFEGPLHMPKLAPVNNVKPCDLVPFHMTKTTKEPRGKWFHFFEDDYQFERIWKDPEQYRPALQRFQGGFSPDFSVLLDMYGGQQIWNTWRNRVLAYWLQTLGIPIIPNASWSDEDSFSWVFDGLPENSMLAFTSVGCMGKDYVCKRSLLNGVHELIRKKNPSALIVYGKFPDEWKRRFSTPIITCQTFTQRKWGK